MRSAGVWKLPRAAGVTPGGDRPLAPPAFLEWMRWRPDRRRSLPGPAGNQTPQVRAPAGGYREPLEFGPPPVRLHEPVGRADQAD